MLSKPVVDHIIRVRMKEFMATKLKWTHKDLHDALLSVGIGVPTRPSLLNYFTAMRLHFGDAKVGFLPQAHQSHTKKRYKKRSQDVLKCLASLVGRCPTQSMF